MEWTQLFAVFRYFLVQSIHFSNVLRLATESEPPYCLTHGLDSIAVRHANDHDVAMRAIDNSLDLYVMFSFILFELISWLGWTVTNTVGHNMTVLFAFGIDRTCRTFAGCHNCNLLGNKRLYYSGLSNSQKLSIRQVIYRAAKSIGELMDSCKHPLTEKSPVF